MDAKILTSNLTSLFITSEESNFISIQRMPYEKYVRIFLYNLIKFYYIYF